jgi:hypothetical protein
MRGSSFPRQPSHDAQCGIGYDRLVRGGKRDVTSANTKAAVLIAVCAIGALRAEAEAGQTVEPQAPAAQVQTPRPAPTRETAVVEEVVSAVDAGYRFRAFVVRWHGARVLVSDPLAESQGDVGDSIRFIVSRHDLNGLRHLSFLSVDNDADRHRKATQVETPDSSVKSETPTATATIEEVLSAEDDGYRFNAYLATWRGTRIAVSTGLCFRYPASSPRAGSNSVSCSSVFQECHRSHRIRRHRGPIRRKAP